MSNSQILERLMAEYGNYVLHICYMELGDYQWAEDATQDTFITVMEKYNTFRGKSEEKAWIFRIAINCSRNIRRKKSFGEIVSDEVGLLCNKKENPIERFIETECVLKALE